MIDCKHRSLVLALALAAAGSIGAVHAQAARDEQIASNPLRNAYFGDLHLHTAYSYDAFLGGATPGPEEAYRFARGESITYLGNPVRRGWPLDFMAVADHAEHIGVLDTLHDSITKEHTNRELERELGGAPDRGTVQGRAKYWRAIGAIVGRKLSSDEGTLSRSAWERVIAAANAYYRPGVFTTFIAYEWTSQPRLQHNLHRNVIFRGDTAPLPFTALDSDRPEDLWAYLEANRKRGIEALAIPHNANASNGYMYDWSDSEGRAIDRAYALRRAFNEPLSEIVQTKGQSESHPLLSPSDELASFEIFDWMTNRTSTRRIHGNYARDAFGRGLVIGGRVGANPYAFGVVGGTDIHNGLSTSDEIAVGGWAEGIDPLAQTFIADMRKKVAGPTATYGYNPAISSGALTGVWAESNTRESIYNALRRKETFATSGTRLQVRFFGGWDYRPGMLRQRNWLEQAYAQGVPMGSDLPAAPRRARAPRFAVWALKDPDGAKLDRVQVIKIWLRAPDDYAEKIFDVAHAPKRERGVGATELRSGWEDPEFDPGIAAVYYVRVLEVPTPRWTTYWHEQGGVPPPAGVPLSIQERGWSSPIWYTPLQ